MSAKLLSRVMAKRAQEMGPALGPNQRVPTTMQGLAAASGAAPVPTLADVGAKHPAQAQALKDTQQLFDMGNRPGLGLPAKPVAAPVVPVPGPNKSVANFAKSSADFTGETPNPDFAKAMTDQQKRVADASAAQAAAARADSAKGGINMANKPIYTPKAPPANSPAGRNAAALKKLNAEGEVTPGSAMPAVDPQPKTNVKTPVKPAIKMETTKIGAVATALGTLLGGGLGAVNDQDDGRTQFDKALRGAGTGAVTGAGIDLGALAGGLLGARMSSDRNLGKGTAIGAGVGATAGGILAYLMARRRDKVQRTYMAKAPKTAGEGLLPALANVGKAEAKAAPSIASRALSLVKENPIKAGVIGTAALGTGAAAATGHLHPVDAAKALVAAPEQSMWDKVKDSAGNAWQATKDYAGGFAQNPFSTNGKGGWDAGHWMGAAGVGIGGALLLAHLMKKRRRDPELDGDEA